MNKGLIRIYGLLSGIGCLTIAYLLNDFTIIRISLLIIGIVLLTCSCVLERNNKIIFFCLFSLIFMGMGVTLDYIIVSTFNKVPILVLSKINNNDVRIYNSIGYRLWQCDINKKEYVLDPMYKLGWFCSTANMEASDINVLLPNLENDYDKYYNTFIKINGRVSDIYNNEYLSMQQYIKNDSTNNEIKFIENIILRVYINDEIAKLNNYKKYDSIEIIGRIIDIERTNDKTIIKMGDTKVVDNDSYSDFKVDIKTDDTCMYDKKLLYSNSDETVYTSCLESAYIKYSETETYELGYALENKKISMRRFLEKANDFKMTDLNANILYTFNNFNVLQCDNAYIIGSLKLNLFSGYCNIDDEDDVSV